MKSSTPLPEPLDDRPFHVAEALERGIGEKRLRGRDLHRPFHAVRSAASLDGDLVGLCRALLTRMPPNSFLNSVTAARLHGVPLPPWIEDDRRLHVAVVAPHRAIRVEGTIGHKVQLMGDDAVELDGLPVASPSRTWCELGRLLPVADLVAAGDFVIRRRGAAREILADAIERFPDRRGRGTLLASIGLLDDRSESPQESRLRVLLLREGVTGLAVNHEVTIAGSRYRIDLALPALKIAIEYQGDYHRDQAQWRRDMTRISRLESVGWAVIQVNADDLANPSELVTRIRRVILSRSGVANRP